jgi:hypothetical protein
VISYSIKNIKIDLYQSAVSFIIIMRLCVGVCVEL